MEDILIHVTYISSAQCAGLGLPESMAAPTQTHLYIWRRHLDTCESPPGWAARLPGLAENGQLSW